MYIIDSSFNYVQFNNVHCKAESGIYVTNFRQHLQPLMAKLFLWGTLLNLEGITSKHLEKFKNFMPR